MLERKTKNNNILPENPHKAWQEFDFAKKGQVSDLATDRWNEIQMNIKNIM